jgi:hypothetical protein
LSKSSFCLWQELKNTNKKVAILGDDSEKIHIMAGMEGFEPPNGGTRTRCLTTWRHPNGKHNCTIEK